MITRSKRKRDRIFDVVKTKSKSPNSFDKFVSSFKKRNNDGDIFVTPFDSNVEEKFFSHQNCFLNEKISLTNSKLKGVAEDGDDQNSLCNQKLYNSKSSKNSSALKSNQFIKICNINVRKIWSREEEIEFLSLFLIYELFQKKIKLTYLTNLITSKKYSQIYQHYYKFKKVIKVFSKLFFLYYDCTQINNLDITEYTAEELFNIFKTNINEANFIKFISENIYDRLTLVYFQNVLAYSTYAPKFFITNENKKINKNSSPELNSSEISKKNDENYSSNISVRKMRSSSYKKSNEKKYLIKDVDFTDLSIGRNKIKNIRLKLSGELSEKLRSYSSNSRAIILDDNFLVNFLISKFDPKFSNSSSKN